MQVAPGAFGLHLVPAVHVRVPASLPQLHAERRRCGNQLRPSCLIAVLCTSCLAAARVRQQRTRIRAAPRGGGEGKGSAPAKEPAIEDMQEDMQERIQRVQLIAAEDDVLLEAEVPNISDALAKVAVSPPAPRYGDVQSARSLPRALPFLPEPGYRKFAANSAGDSGFDPLGLCNDVTEFVQYREAELKHGRLCMLAALAWPLVEALEPDFVEEYGLPDPYAASGGRLLPQFSGISGDIGDVFLEYFAVLVFLFGAFFELNGSRSGKVGDLGFDPLGLTGWRPPFLRSLLPKRRFWMPEAEVNHGRFAMMVVLYDVIDEILTGNPVVEDTEYAFHRISWKYLSLEYWLTGKEAAIGEFPPSIELNL